MSVIHRHVFIMTSNAVGTTGYNILHASELQLVCYI